MAASSVTFTASSTLAAATNIIGLSPMSPSRLARLFKGGPKDEKIKRSHYFSFTHNLALSLYLSLSLSLSLSRRRWTVFLLYICGPCRYWLGANMKKGSNFSFDTSFFVFVGARKTSASRLEEKVPLSLPLSSPSLSMFWCKSNLCMSWSWTWYSQKDHAYSLSLSVYPL